MRSIPLLLMVCAVVMPQSATGESPATELGFRQDTEIIQGPETELFCPATTLRRHDDNSFENGYCWRFMGVVPPDYGSWAECYEAEYVCAIEFLFTHTGYYIGQTMDVYLWESVADGNPPPGPDPGNVICYLSDVPPGPMGLWPEVSKHDVEICCETNGLLFAGFWGRWPGASCAWFVASDEDGAGGGCPRTKIAPDIGYEPGWHHPDIVPTFENVKALGIRILAGRGDCTTSSVPDPDEVGIRGDRKTTWGAIKSLY